MAIIKRTAQGSKGAPAKRKKKAVKAPEKLDKNPEDFFMASDDEDGGRGSDSEKDAEETAEEKRLRIAKAYLADLKSKATSDDDEGTSMSEDEGYDDRERDDDNEEDLLGERLKKNAAEDLGYVNRTLAHRLRLPSVAECSSSAPARLLRGHRLPPTAIALTEDDTTMYSVAKDGSMFRWDVESGKKMRMGEGEAVLTAALPEEGAGADWIPKSGSKVSRRALLSVSTSSDGTLVAAAGGDRKVHIFDTRTLQEVIAFPGHRDVVSSVAFREGSHELYTAGFDRTIKLWSVDDRAYMDTLFGHQAEILCLDIRRMERPITGGFDHTVRAWKVQEESQLVFRSHSMAVECCALVSQNQWVTGDQDGTLALWSMTKKKPVRVYRSSTGPLVAQHGAGSVSDSCATWITSVAACRGSDLMASGAGDGVVRFWKTEGDNRAGLNSLTLLGGLPLRGFVNGLRVAKSGRFAVAAVGQEPRLGRWARDAKARNGVAIMKLEQE